MNKGISAQLQRFTDRTPWNKIFSYDNETDVTFIIEARGHGKTFGLREQFVRDWIKNRSHFCAITRNENQIPEIARDYFGLLNKPDEQGLPSSQLCRDYNICFKRVGYVYYAQILEDDDTPNSDKWEIIGYFVSLSKAQKYKELTFTNVRRMVFDECLIEQPNPRNNYLPNEFEAFNSLVYTVFREQPNQKKQHNIYLLSNACNMVNPYFEAYNVNDIPPKGFSRWGDKQLLLYVGSNIAYSTRMELDTIAGRMAARTNYGRLALDNDFTESDYTDFIARKPNTARLLYGIAVNSHILYVWCDVSQGIYYINQQNVNNDNLIIYALTSNDNKINYRIAKRSAPAIQGLMKMYSYNCVRFDSFETQSLCLNSIFRIYNFN